MERNWSQNHHHQISALVKKLVLNTFTNSLDVVYWTKTSVIRLMEDAM